jgi:putative GTP pyrophosphokinase
MDDTVKAPWGSKGRVNRAGDAVRRDCATEDDLAVINTWRASHKAVLNTFQALLRGRARGRRIVVAQRLKRLPTILHKLEREPAMQLSRMDDVAGCRLIFSTMEELFAFRREIHAARVKHSRRNADDKYNYILRAKDTGYRGVHDIYEYNVNSSKGKPYSGLMLELQYRTNVQHAWATAVEVVGFVTAHQPKFRRGDQRYEEFFRISSEILSRTHEDMRSCLPSLSNRVLLDQFKAVNGEINLLNTLKGLHVADKEIANRNTVVLAFGDSGLTVYTYPNLTQATDAYFKFERETAGVDYVLARAETWDEVRSAYRNYFSDTNDFVALLESGLNDMTMDGSSDRGAEAVLP